MVSVEPHCGGAGDHHDEGREGPLITNNSESYISCVCKIGSIDIIVYCFP